MLPKTRNINVEKYIGGLSKLEKISDPIKLSANESALGPSPRAIEVFKKDQRTKEDFEKTLRLIKKYKAVEDSIQRAEYFVNVSHDALGIFKDCPEKKILQNLTGFSLNRSF